MNVERKNAQELSEIAVLENDIVHLNNLISSFNEQIEHSKNSSAQTTNQLNEQNERLINLKQEENENTNSISQVSQDFEKLSLEYNETDKDFNTNNGGVNKLYIKKSELNFQIESTTLAISETQALIEQSKLEKSEIEELIENLKNENIELLQAGAEVEEALSEHNNKLNGYSKLLERKNANLLSAKKDFSETDIKIRELTQRQRLLIDLENNMEGFSFSVKEVVKAGKSGRISGIKGSIAQLIKVDSKYSVAIETALGAALQNIIVENEDTAKRCINLLKEKNAGRATFLPMTSVKGYTLSQNNLDMQEGYIAIASELVSFDTAYSQIINSLLGRIVIAEDIDFATAISKKYGYKFRIVTLDGQVINAGGSFTGGSSSRTTGVLTRKNEIDSIKKQLEILSKNHEELKARELQYQAEVDKLCIDVEAEKENISIVTSDKIRFDSELKHLRITIEQKQEKNESVEKNIILFNNKLNNQNIIIESSKAALVNCEKEIAEKESEISKAKLLIENYQSEREFLSEKLSLLKMKQIEISKDIQSCELNISQLNKIASESETDFEKFEEQIENTKISIAEKQEIISDKNDIITNSKNEVEKINNNIKEEQVNHQKYEIEANENRNYSKIKKEEKETI